MARCRGKADIEPGREVWGSAELTSEVKSKFQLWFMAPHLSGIGEGGGPFLVFQYVSHEVGAIKRTKDPSSKQLQSANPPSRASHLILLEHGCSH
jgi:hypothetical protein